MLINLAAFGGNDEQGSTCAACLVPKGALNAKLELSSASYWRYTFTSVETTSIVQNNGIYKGWCSDTQHFWNPGDQHHVRLISTYDTKMPIADRNPNWDKVNWLINHKDKNGTVLETQNAIWKLLGQNPPSSQTVNNATVLALYTAALKNGTGFRPKEGQSIVILVEPNCDNDNNKFQVTLVELFCPRPESFWKSNTSAWTATIFDLGFAKYNTAVAADVQALLKILNMPRTSTLLTLESALIIAELNIAAGANAGNLQSTIADIIQLLKAGGGTIIGTACNTCDVAITEIALLTTFNQGSFCVCFVQSGKSYADDDGKNEDDKDHKDH